jgi:carbon-monoxide dehydrogenase medium subunit
MTFDDLFLGPGKSALKHGEELLTGFFIPKNNKPQQASCFKRIMRPQGVALPILNLAIWMEGEGALIREIRIAVGPGAATPWRARQTEEALVGKPLNEMNRKTAVEILLSHVGFRSSARRASAEYRRHLVEGLFEETLTTALQRTTRPA